jgi:hypothetical protein
MATVAPLAFSQGPLVDGLTAAAGLGRRPPLPWAAVVLRCEVAGNAIVREPAVAAARVRERAPAGEVPCAGVRCCGCLSSTCGRQSSGAYGAAGPRPAWVARASAQQASTTLMRFALAVHSAAWAGGARNRTTVVNAFSVRQALLRCCGLVGSKSVVSDCCVAISCALAAAAGSWRRRPLGPVVRVVPGRRAR